MTEAQLAPQIPRAGAIAELLHSIGDVIKGKDEAILLAVCAFLAGGHVLIEDVPGVGKTSLARALAQSSGCSWNRVQFTPDLLPSDITGSTVFNQSDSTFIFRPGPLFTNIVLADEINRASPKTQSALLEAMQERSVSYDGRTYPLPNPQMVIATQNPIDHEGTFPLPESELDRFMMKIRLGYPSRESEIAMMQTHGVSKQEAAPVTTPTMIGDLIRQAREIFVAPSIMAYIVDIAAETRNQAHVALGASPRATLSLEAASRSWALLAGRSYVLPDDVQAIAPAVLSHRILLQPESRMSGVTPENVVANALASIAAPTTRD